METIRKEIKFCASCMQEHEVSYVRIPEINIYKNQKVEYMATYEYCDVADEYIASEQYIDENDISMKDAYRQKMGLLTSTQIIEIRKKYGISQTDLSRLLGWGEKTIARYERHQVQNAAHDTILKKIDSDPDWFLELLKENKDKFSPSSYEKYHLTAKELFNEFQDVYLRKSIEAKYIKINGDISHCGGTSLNIDKIIDVVRYLSNSKEVINLFKVKLMKMLWYLDSLSFKRRGYSMTGLAYCALPMGAVPVAHELIIDLQGIAYEEIDFGESTGYHFLQSDIRTYPTLTNEDLDIIDTVIKVCGKDSKNKIIERMHRERAYIETAKYDYIQYEYAKDLSID